MDAAAEKLSCDSGVSGTEDPAILPAVVATRYRAGDMTLSLFSTITQFGAAEDIALADLKIELMFPADDETRKLLIANFGGEAG